METRDELLCRMKARLLAWKDADKYQTYEERAKLARIKCKSITELFVKTPIYLDVLHNCRLSPSSPLHFGGVLSLADLVTIVDDKKNNTRPFVVPVASCQPRINVVFGKEKDGATGAQGNCSNDCVGTVAQGDISLVSDEQKTE
jgi:hypothetical protein